MEKITNVTVVNKTVRVFFGEERIIEYAYIWLRDHCRCSSCYRSDTSQRAIHILDVPYSLITDLKFDKDNIYITWDDKHESVYKAEFLIQFDYKTWVNKRKRNPVLWYGDEVEKKLAKITFNNLINSSVGARSIFKSLLDYGIAVIENVEPTITGTEEVCNALGGVQHTMYGKMWLVRKGFDHEDVAYTNGSLASHTDATYFTEAAGLLIFQCLEHSNGRGGETTLVDGFHCAQRLKNDFPEDYEFLTQFEVDAEFMESGHFEKHSAPVIILDKNKDINQIRFNSYDRAPTAFSSRVECEAYYRALKNLTKYFEDITNQWHIKLRPGIAIAIDNFRVLHGRTSFSGNRVICGGYVSRTDWLDKARTLEVIE